MELGREYEDIPDGWMDAAKVARRKYYAMERRTHCPPLEPRPDPPVGISSSIMMPIEKRVTMASQAVMSGLMTKEEARERFGV
jgi:hypothetical protein